MREADLVGNIFLLDKHIGRKQIVVAFLTALFIALFKFLLENQTISENFTIEEFMYPLLGLSAVYVLINISLIIQFFKKYFTFNWMLFFGTIFEIFSFFVIVYISKGEIYGWILGIFWLFSGLMRVLIQFSKSIFISEVKDYLKIIQIFAYSRAGYFATIIILISNLVSIRLPLFWLIYFLIIFLGVGWFIVNLYPYMTKHQNVINVIELMRIVKDQKRIKINQLKQMARFSESYFNKILRRLSSANYLEIENKRVELGKGFKYIYTS